MKKKETPYKFPKDWGKMKQEKKEVKQKPIIIDFKGSFIYNSGENCINIKGVLPPGSVIKNGYFIFDKTIKEATVRLNSIEYKRFLRSIKNVGKK